MEKTINKSSRNSAIELLRIISIFSIVLCHFATHGGFDFAKDSITIPRLWWNFIEMGGNFGVDVFVLISGYFLIENTTKLFDFKKILKLVGGIWLYSIILFIFSVVIGNSVGIKDIVTAFFPLTFSVWRFASTYFVMFLLHPFINKLLHALDKGQYRKLLVLLTVLWCVISTFLSSNYQANQLCEFLYLYAIAGYFKIYGVGDRLKSKHCFGWFALFTALTYLSCLFFMIAGTKFESLSGFALYFYGRNKIPTILRAVFIFLAFIKMKPFYSKWINKIASATFGVYLLHDSPVLRKYFWIDLFKNASFQESAVIIPYSIGICILVYIGCTVIDLIRQRLIEKPCMKLLFKYESNLSKPFERIYNKIFR